MTAIAPADLDADACVVGGSPAGLMTALMLARQGLSVLLLTRGDIMPPPQMGVLTAGLSLWLAEGREHLSRESARAAFDLSLEAMAGALPLLEGLGLERHGRGLLRVAAAHERARLNDEDEARDMLGLLELRRWQPEEIAAVTGSTRHVGATYEPQALVFDLSAMTEALVHALRAAGTRILERTPVASADLDGVRKYLHTLRGRVRADHVVICGAGAEAGFAPWLSGALLRAPHVRGGFAVRAVRPDFSGLVAEPGPLGARFMPGVGELDFETPVALPAIGQVGAAVALRGRARTIYPELRRRIAEHAHGFSLERAPHGLPLIGQRRQGLWYAAGLGANGLGNAALAAHVITDGIVARGGKIAELAPLQPRYAFGPLGQVADAVRFGWRRVGGAVAHARAVRDGHGAEPAEPAAAAVMDAEEGKGTPSLNS